MANNPNEMKQILLNMKFDEITKSFFEDNFAKFFDKKSGKLIPPKYNLTDKITLEPDQCHNKTKVETTLGRLLVNKFLFEDELYKIIGYFNKPFSKKGIKECETLISNGILDGVIKTDAVLRYYDRIQWLGLTFHSVVCGSFSEKTIAPLPEVLKLKEELFKKYAEDLKGPNGVVYANKIESMLLEEAAKVLNDDPGMDLYRSGSKGDFGNNYKNMMVIRGPVYNNVTKKFDFLKASLAEGIQKEEIPTYGTDITAGAYPKAVGTRVAGYYTKKFFSSYQTVVLDSRNSDCGSKKFRKVLLNEKSYNSIKYRWMKTSKGLICLTPDIAPKYFGQVIEIRSPLYCAGKKLCAKCAGDLAYRLNTQNIGLVVPAIAGSFLQKKMKVFHSSVISLYQIKINSMFQ